MTTHLAPLLAALEAAPGPDRRLDRWCYVATQFDLDLVNKKFGSIEKWIDMAQLQNWNSPHPTRYEHEALAILRQTIPGARTRLQFGAGFSSATIIVRPTPVRHQLKVKAKRSDECLALAILTATIKTLVEAEAEKNVN